jgi:hypothetical protein
MFVAVAFPLELRRQLNRLQNPAPFTAPYEFEITFECLENLSKDLEWKLTYVGSATSYVPHASQHSSAPRPAD